MMSHVEFHQRRALKKMIKDSGLFVNSRDHLRQSLIAVLDVISSFQWQRPTQSRGSMAMKMEGAIGITPVGANAIIAAPTLSAHVMLRAID
jgi:hypothetical protein